MNPPLRALHLLADVIEELTDGEQGVIVHVTRTHGCLVSVVEVLGERFDLRMIGSVVMAPNAAALRSLLPVVGVST